MGRNFRLRFGSAAGGGGCGARPWPRLAGGGGGGAGGCRQGAGPRLLEQLGNRRLDRFVRRELGLGVEVELTGIPAQGLDDGVVPGGRLSNGVEEVSEEEVERGRLLPVVAEGQRAGRSLCLRRLEQRP